MLEQEEKEGLTNEAGAAEKTPDENLNDSTDSIDPEVGPFICKFCKVKYVYVTNF